MKKIIKWFKDKWDERKRKKRFKKKIEGSDYLTIIGSSLNKKNDNCMITSLGQKINLSSSGWNSFREDN